MKFAGIFTAFAMAGTAFSAAIPRTVIADTILGMTTASAALNELDHVIKAIRPLACNQANKDEINELAKGIYT